MLGTCHRAALVAVLLGLLAGPALAAKGVVEITSAPGGAKVYIDGQRKGDTPTLPGKALVLDLEEGEYRLEAVLDEPPMRAQSTIYVAAGAIQPAHLALVAVPAMVRIPAGSFRMGCGSTDTNCEDNERPAHSVRVAAFEIGKHEVTFAEWDACRADGGCAHKPGDEGWGRGNRPVINVSWDDAQQYLRWLSRKTGTPYRLPTEAEWEYAARAGTTTAYSFGDDASALGRYAWYEANSGRQTHPVGQKQPNPWGLYDIHGNVWEWVEDCWNASYQGAPTDGSAWRSGECPRRVLRGGSWYNDPRNLRAANRIWDGSGYRDFKIGFRVARTLTP